MANSIRALSMDAVQQANSGHPGMPMGMADVATVLFSQFLKYHPQDPEWMNRDRFVLSAGHGSMLLYSLLHLTGYKDFPIEQIKNFRQLGFRTAGHPEFQHGRGIETTTGPLGQGMATAVGMALAERQLAAHFGSELINHRTYVIVGDGCLMEGISYEAASLAGHQRLNKLIVLWDDNDITIDGATSLSTSENIIDRFSAANWRTLACDGHDFTSITEALTIAQRADKPVLIACKTVIGKGAPNKQGTASAHGAPLGAEEIGLARKYLNWQHPPFHIPSEIYHDWQQVASRHSNDYHTWQQKLSQHPQQQEFQRRCQGELAKDLDAVINNYKLQLLEQKAEVASRKSSQLVLNKLLAKIPELIGGSADLTGSNLTKADNQPLLNSDSISGSYIHFGIREHAMAATMNGLALYGGFIPYGGTFLVFSDYCRPALRLSALMKLRTIYVMTHDSIGLGEDGPTHQPVETLASLRLLPNVNVLRPCDSIETLECWQIALTDKQNKTNILALSRQGLRPLRDKHSEQNLCSQGGYVLRDANAAQQVTIMATGSEVAIAVAAKQQLEAQGIGCRVVSVPCLEKFATDTKHLRNTLGSYQVLASIEAASVQPWQAFVHRPHVIIGMCDFGASAPIDDLYEHFGITAENLVKQILQAFTQ